MKKCLWSRGIILLFTVLLYTLFIVPIHADGISAGEPLLIVTDSWPPYAIEGEGNIRGTDVEITKAVFQQLGIAVEIKFYPWARSLLMVENQEADAILDASITPEREEFLYFPEEPVSEGITVFFIQKGRFIPFTTLEDLNELTAGALIGYSYCDEIDNALFMVNPELVSSLETSFRMLLANRLDFLIEVDSVGYFTAKQMGILDQIDIIPNATYCQGGNYLAFSKKPGNDELASQFSRALLEFKMTNEYKNILNTYGINIE